AGTRRPSGSVWHYSHATDVLGHVLEVAMGCDLAQVLDDTLLAPLGMRETWFAVPPSEVGRVAEPLPQALGQRPLFFDPRKPRRG
ncbi:serine hydrolase domain-containing protein, partial [Streptomyces sp. P17]|uniref:serine hydrolase domain-containing protein n=1 Tax=Streptomyces sp. P17 TaxID=3074716 RepID=UPI0028F45947